MERNQRSEWARGFEDLEVFRRAYRVSLEVHRASLEFPAIEQRALADQFRPATCLETGVSPVRDDGVGLGRRDAGVDDLLPGSRLSRREDGGSLAGRVSRNRPYAHRPAS